MSDELLLKLNLDVRKSSLTCSMKYWKSKLLLLFKILEPRTEGHNRKRKNKFITVLALHSIFSSIPTHSKVSSTFLATHIIGKTSQEIPKRTQAISHNSSPLYSRPNSSIFKLSTLSWYSFILSWQKFIIIPFFGFFLLENVSRLVKKDIFELTSNRIFEI